MRLIKRCLLILDDSSLRIDWHYLHLIDSVKELIKLISNQVLLGSKGVSDILLSSFNLPLDLLKDDASILF